jgi:alkylhydroperoxidase/carboxymuconolactone decarboxylase family protein YurZ
MAKAKSTIPKIIAHLKEAKTGSEMIRSWGYAFTGGGSDPAHEELAKKSIYARRIPDLIKDYGHYPTIHSLERRKLDPKTRALIQIACYCINCHWSAIGHWAISAKRAGATDDEILEAAAVANFANSKSKMVETDIVMSAVFNDSVFKATKS